MRALIWKEVKELAPGFWLIVGTSWALGIVDLAYNWRGPRAVGISLGFVGLMSILGALLAGANSFARESRAQTVFLSSWPIPRRHIWLAKTIVPAVMWAAMVALATAGCLGLLALRGYDYAQATKVLDPGGIDLAAAGIAWALLFGAGLLASVVAPSAMSAAMIAVVLCVGAIGGWVALWHGVPAWFGPSLGLVLPDFGAVNQLWPALGFLALCIAECGIVITRHLPAEWPRRAWITAASFLAGVALLLALGLGGAWLALRPGPPTEIEGIEPGGRWLVLGSQDGALWVADVEGERLRLLARAPVSSGHGWADVRSPRIAFSWGTSKSAGGVQLWVADLESGRRWRLPYTSTVISPGGHYWLNVDTDGATVRPIGPAPHGPQRVPISPDQWVADWSPDESTIYFCSPDDVRNRTVLYAVPAFADGAPRLIGEYEGRMYFEGISPDGRWLRAWRWEDRERSSSGMMTTSFAVLVSLETGEMIELGGLWSIWAEWTADGRYVWYESAHEEGEKRFPAVYDLRRREVVRTITAQDVDGMTPYYVIASAHSDDVVIFAHGLVLVDGKQPRAWWLARSDGAELRPTGLAQEARIVGWTHEGDLVYRQGREVRRLDPETLQSRTIMTLAEEKTEAKE